VFLINFCTECVCYRNIRAVCGVTVVKAWKLASGTFPRRLLIVMQLPANHRQFESEIAADRRDPRQPADRALGRVIGCSGSRATIAATMSGTASTARDGCAIGRLLSINLGTSRIVGLVYEMRALDPVWSDVGTNAVAVEVELLGEVVDGESGAARFDSGITTYPPIGALVHRIRARDLECIHDLGQRKGVVLGSLTQDAAVAASVDIERLLSRHFAVLGTTGVGKSSAVALILRKAIEAKPNLRVLILDPHNEYARAFPIIARGSMRARSTCRSGCSASRSSPTSSSAAARRWRTRPRSCARSLRLPGPATAPCPPRTWRAISAAAY
jgi:hypothetical protein